LLLLLAFDSPSAGLRRSATLLPEMDKRPESELDLNPACTGDG